MHLITMRRLRRAILPLAAILATSAAAQAADVTVYSALEADQL